MQLEVGDGEAEVELVVDRRRHPRGPARGPQSLTLMKAMPSRVPCVHRHRERQPVGSHHSGPPYAFLSSSCTGKATNGAKKTSSSSSCPRVAVSASATSHKTAPEPLRGERACATTWPFCAVFR